MAAACRAMSGVEPPFEVLWATFCWRMRASKWREPCPRPLHAPPQIDFVLLMAGLAGGGRSKGADGAAKTNQARAVFCYQ
jgi:hypothetical protein